MAIDNAGNDLPGVCDLSELIPYPPSLPRDLPMLLLLEELVEEFNHFTPFPA